MHTRVMLSAAVAAAATLTGIARAEVVTVNVLDQDSGEPLPGATVVLAGDGQEQRIEVTGEDGRATVEVPFGAWTATVYHGDSTAERTFVLLPGEDTAVAVTVAVPPGSDPGGCVLFAPDPGTWFRDPFPAHRALVDDAVIGWPLTRDRRVPSAARATVAALGAAPVIYLDGARLLPGAPAPALAVTDDADLHAGLAPIERASAAGGVLRVSPLGGANDLGGSARLALARAAGFELAGRGAIARDHAWWSAGAALDRGADGALTGEALATVAGAWDAGTQGRVLGRHAADGAATDTLVDGAFVKQLDDGKLTIETGVRAERLARPTTTTTSARAGGAGPARVDRLAGRLLVRRRFRGHGHHGATVGGEVGGGRADGLRHADTSGFLADDWQVTPRLTVRAGLRWDHRQLGPASAELWAPRLGASYDWRGEGTRAAYVTVERVSHLDQHALGAWRTATPWHDEASAGAAAIVAERWTVGAGARGRWFDTTAARAAGAEAFVHYRHGATWAAATLATLDRAAAITAARTLGRRELARVEAVVRTTPVDTTWGAALRLRHHDLSLGAELFDLDDAATRTARVVLTAAW